MCSDKYIFSYSKLKERDLDFLLTDYVPRLNKKCDNKMPLSAHVNLFHQLRAVYNTHRASMSPEEITNLVTVLDSL